MRGNGASGFFLMVGDRTTPVFAEVPAAGRQRNINVVPGQMCVQRLTVMVTGLFGVEVHVHQRRADRANLHEHDKSRGRQPAKHMGIVVKDRGRRHLTSF